ncbi:hypothetical protein ACFL2V_11200 [Pseudomonadota bacterium]
MQKVATIRYIIFSTLVIQGLLIINMIWGVYRFPQFIDFKIMQTLAVIFIISIFIGTHLDKLERNKGKYLTKEEKGVE